MSRRASELRRVVDAGFVPVDPDTATTTPCNQIRVADAMFRVILLLSEGNPKHCDPRARERAVRVLVMRFGLLGTPDMTLKEVGAAMGVNPERIRQIESKALRELRRPRMRAALEDLADAVGYGDDPPRDPRPWGDWYPDGPPRRWAR